MKNFLLLLVFVSSISFAQGFDYKDYNALLKKYVAENGNVNYNKLKQNKSELTEVIHQFQKFGIKDNTAKNEKTAFYINLYNIYTLKAIVDNYPVKSIKKISNVWDKESVIVGKQKLSLSDIEHKILRKLGDPRIHFAINCASVSCPKLQNIAFTSGTLDKQLDKAAEGFINDKSKNEISTSEVKISPIFNWFSSDFKTKNSGIVSYLNKYATIKIENNAKIKFQNYNWNLNE